MRLKLYIMNEYVNELVKLPDRRMVMSFDPEYLVVFDHMVDWGGTHVNDFMYVFRLIRNSSFPLEKELPRPCIRLPKVTQKNPDSHWS